jgi:hypothetical protein
MASMSQSVEEMATKSETSKPLTSLKRFALKLGWRRLRLHRNVFDDGKVITWYVAGKADGSRGDLFLQLNECPIGQAVTYSAAVYATRYRLCSGWHSMTLSTDTAHNDVEAKRLDVWLHRRWFDTLAGRRQYRSRHPECTGWSWSRIARERLPYEVVDASRCMTARIAQLSV